jgi:hypothetical protein
VLGALYAAAFTTLLLQGPALLGSGGVSPAASHLALVAEQLTGSADYSRCVFLCVVFSFLANDGCMLIYAKQTRHSSPAYLKLTHKTN